MRGEVACLQGAVQRAIVILLQHPLACGFVLLLLELLYKLIGSGYACIAYVIVDDVPVAAAAGNLKDGVG